MKFVHKLRQRGVTLFEVLLVLFVAAFIAVAVGTIYNKVLVSIKTNALISNVQQMASGIHSLYASAGNNYTGVTSAIVMGSGIAPKDMVNALGTIRVTPFDPASTADLWEVVPNGTTMFTITVKGLPSSACSALGSSSLAGGAVSVVASGGTTTTDPGAVAAGCAATGNTASVGINFN